jgi:hypothetical protein
MKEAIGEHQDFVLELGNPDRRAELGAAIARLRAEGVSWKDTCQQLSLPLATACTYLKRYLELKRDQDAA